MYSHRSLRLHGLGLAIALSAASFASLARAQQNPLEQAVGLANGVLGNAPTSDPGGSPRSRSRSRSRSRATTRSTGVTPLTAGAPRQVLVAAADGYMNLPLETFQTTRRLRPPPYDWSSEGCSFGEVSGPFRDSFNRACDRHSFGYRNYGGTGLALDRTETRRTRIDDRLRDDLNGLCRGEHAGLTETPCLVAAQAVYSGTRSSGQSWFMSGTGRPPSLPTPSVPGFNNGANAGPIPGVPVPGLGGGQGNGLPVPGLGGGQGNGLPIPGMGNGMNPGQVLTAPGQVLGAPGQVLNGGR